jgi:hypothetical protein
MPQSLTSQHLTDLRSLSAAARDAAEAIDALSDATDGYRLEHIIWNLGLLAGNMIPVLAAHTYYTLTLSRTDGEPRPELPSADTSSLIAEAESLLAGTTKGPWDSQEQYGAVYSTTAVPSHDELRGGYFDGYRGVMVCESVRPHNRAFLARSHGLVTELVAALKDAQKDAQKSGKA